MSCVFAVSIPFMPLAPSCGRGGNVGLLFSRTGAAAAAFCWAAGANITPPYPWMYGSLMFMAAVCAGVGKFGSSPPGLGRG